MVKKGAFEKLLQLLKQGNNVTDSCKLSGIHRQTYYKWLKTDKEKIIEIEKAQIEFKAENIEIIRNAAPKNWTAAAWLLERKYTDEYGRKEKIEINNKLDEWLEAFEKIGKDS